MRICLVVHGFPPVERTGVEGYTEALAAELARQGHAVEVFAPRVRTDLPQHSLRREEREGYAVSWLTTNVAPRSPAEQLDPPGVAGRFGEFLDRERPELVHAQHLVKLGTGLVAEARERDIPLVYTAHDYYPVCHRYTFLRPDLRRCDVVGDAMACALCDLALGFLNEREGLGDYQMGALPEQLRPGEREALRRLLDGAPESAGRSLDDLDRAFDVRQVLDGRRAQAYHAIDRVISPTRFLADRLVAGGIDRRRVTVLPYGVAAADLAAVPPPRAGGGPVRFGYLGGLSKHKGVHLLLEAFHRLEAEAELTVWGYSTDEPYVRRLREAAGRAGAVWGGPYRRAELPGILERVDVLVVPSTWYENQPFVIREAFAARRPVVAPDLGALPESVRHEVDGLLYPPDDVDGLAAALQRLAGEEGLVERLSRGTVPPVPLDEHARALVELYEEVRAAAAPPPPAERLPASIRPLAERHAELRALSTRELFDRTLRGLARLREGLGGTVAEEPLEVLLERAIAHGSRAQTILRDRRSEAAWLRETLESERGRAEWLRGVVDDRAEAVRALERERAWLRESRDALEKERDWMKGVLQKKEEEIGWLRGVVAGHREQADEAMAEVADARRRLRDTARLGLAALEAQEHVLGDEVRPLLDVLRRAVHDEDLAEVPHPGGLQGAVEELREAAERLRRLEDELAWRRAEMRDAVALARRRLVQRLVGRTGLGRRVLGWDGRPGPPERPEPEPEPERTPADEEEEAP